MRAETEQNASLRDQRPETKGARARTDAVVPETYGETKRLGELLRRHLQRLGLPVPDGVPSAWERASSELLNSYTARQVEGVIAWLGRDEFWQTRILTFQALLKAFPRLLLRAQNEGGLTRERPVGPRGGKAERVQAALRKDGLTDEEIQRVLQ